MELIVQLVGAAALVTIAIGLFSGRLQGPAGPAGPRGPKGDPGERGLPGESKILPSAAHAPAPHAHGRVHIWETCTRDGNTFVRQGLVREGTKAWRAAYDAPGVYLRRHDGEVHEGVQ